MRDRIAKIEVETGHLVQMVNELLDLARIESGGPLVLLDDVDLGRLAADVGRAAAAVRRAPGRRARRRRRRPACRRSAATRRGSARSSSTSSTTPSSSARDGGDVTVRVARATDGEVVTSVEDHGVGVPKAAQARIFERFYKVDRARVRGRRDRARACRSPATSSSSTAAGSGSSPRRASARRSRSPCRSPRGSNPSD